MAGCPHAPYGALEQRVSREHVAAVDQQREHPRRVPGSVQWLDLERPALDRDARLHGARSGRHPLALQRVDEHLCLGMALEHLAQLGHVVVMVMGQQDMRELERAAGEEVVERTDRTAGRAW